MNVMQWFKTWQIRRGSRRFWKVIRANAVPYKTQRQLRKEHGYAH